MKKFGGILLNFSFLKFYLHIMKYIHKKKEYN